MAKKDNLGTNPNKPNNSNSSQGWIPIVVIVVAVVAVVAVLAVAMNRSASNLSERESESEEGIIQDRDVDENLNEISMIDPDEEPEGTEDLVIFGVDSRSNDLGIGTRSDSIMIVHIDHDEKEIKICSIYRDCMVSIEGHGYEKITHAHQYGGPELALSTINENFDLDIEKYMTLNFSSVTDLIDEIGGVEMDIDEDEVSRISTNPNGNGEPLEGKFCGVITEPGTYMLDGAQAVAYSRIRHTYGYDYKRTERQRDVLIALLDKAKTMEADDVLTLVDDMLNMINSNYRAADLTNMIYYLTDYDIVETDAFPKVFYGGTVEGAWVEVPITLIDMNAGIHEFLYDETDYTPSRDVENINDVLLEKESVPNEDFYTNPY